MIIMEKDKYSVRVLIDTIINEATNSQLNTILEQITNNNILSLFGNDVIEEEKLLKLLKLSIDNDVIKQIINDLIFLVDSSSITDNVLNYCISYPDEYRETLLVQLAHMWLGEQQLEIINKEISTPEAFCKLFYIYSANENYDINQYEVFLSENISHIQEIDCLGMILMHRIIISDAKKDIVIKYTS